MATMSPSLTLRLFLTTLFMRIFSSVSVSSDRTMQTLSFRFLPYTKIASLTKVRILSGALVLVPYHTERQCYGTGIAILP